MSYIIGLFRIFHEVKHFWNVGVGIYGANRLKRKPFKWPFNEVLRGYPYFHSVFKFGTILEPFKRILEGGMRKACEVFETSQARKGQI